MSRPIPFCERCGFAHAGDEPCFGRMDKDDCETTLDERIRKRHEAAEREYDSDKCD